MSKHVGKCVIKDCTNKATKINAFMMPLCEKHFNDESISNALASTKKYLNDKKGFKIK